MEDLNFESQSLLICMNAATDRPIFWSGPTFGIQPDHTFTAEDFQPERLTELLTRRADHVLAPKHQCTQVTQS